VNNTLAELPTAKEVVSAQDVLKALEAIEKGKLYEFVSVGYQQMISNATMVVRAIQAKRKPVFDMANTTFMSSVGDRVSCFCLHVSPRDLGDEDQVFVGKAAVAEMLKPAEMKRATTPLTYEDIGFFRICLWLLEPSEQGKVDAWLAELSGSKSAVAVAEIAKPKGSSAKKARMEAEKKKVNKAKLKKDFWLNL